ncbi:type II toxin-antitoxin system death-on-curing family toxin [Cryobacterium mannosilyticum]|uniref:Type II toxin-antitoxin system death-on-curing family toxin n=1 Tax=Cryobacterium mannosilyticum TaxID=1259190 RepID=A0A4R8WB82_9MICO|nr:type II toxin-antitoxin system death-on-curing family toxin [Cryobacterium mannosilyticum]TFC05360.1 type II toxin-antitoxin system death-on-curing family toxin [Cryobacterium mannosilyticum]
MVDYIEPEQAVAVVAHLGLHVRDKGLLFSALARPAAGMFGEDAYAARELKAAALMSSLAQNHALFDGNKRLSWILTLAFLRLNGFRVVMPTDEAFDFVIAVAQSQLELEEIASTLARHLVATTPRPAPPSASTEKVDFGKEGRVVADGTADLDDSERRSAAHRVTRP